MEEVYKVCKKTKCGVYEISNYGNMKRNGITYIPNEAPNGYLRTSFALVHRLVAEYFIPNPDNKPCVDHIDTDRHNNRADNLRWCTLSENMMNPITRKKNSEAQHKVFTEEVRKERSESKKLYYINHPEVRKKQSESAKNRERSRWQRMTDGINTVCVETEYWGEFIDIGYWFKSKRIYKKSTYKNINI